MADASAEWYRDQAAVMGTAVSVDLWSEDQAQGERLVTKVMAEYRRIDSLMSTYKSDSELSLLNRDGSLRAVVISPELYRLIERALELSRTSSGAFDVTYESVGYLYDFRQRQRPTGEQIASHLDAVDYRLVELLPEKSAVRFKRDGMRINLGGIAKGYAVERGASMLRRAGIEHAVLVAGGDTRVIGDRRGQPWLVGIRSPRDPSRMATRVPIVDEAISTSGDYERFFDEGGERFHHIINPSTGTPSRGVQSASVIGPDATVTDALSTTVFVMGVQAGLALIETLPDYEAIVVDADGRLFFSQGLAAQ